MALEKDAHRKGFDGSTPPRGDSTKGDCGRVSIDPHCEGGQITVAKEITIKGQPARKGERMTKGKGWRLATVKGRRRVFVGTLLDTVNHGKARIAIFSVPK
jgi:hypothetical protein